MADNNSDTGKPPKEFVSSISRTHSKPVEYSQSQQATIEKQRTKRDNTSRGRGRGKMGNRGGQGSQRNERNPSKRGEKGRGEWSRNPVDKRKRNDEEQAAKRQKIENGRADHTPFTAEEIASEERKPKRKVAVMIGYAGSGYKGMQINTQEKTIEGDLFTAFVAAGAISKANADDPKKSSLVRCARTDKGVHAAGNMISLKLIVEDPDIVEKINQSLPPQIRVWGIERTNGSFSCYQTCDSRWYEYLIPTYSFLPPHPHSFLGKKLVESAEKEGVYESYKSRQDEVADFWDETEKTFVKPILDRFDSEMQKMIVESIHAPEEDHIEQSKNCDKSDGLSKPLSAELSTAIGKTDPETAVSNDEFVDVMKEQTDWMEAQVPDKAQTGTDDINKSEVGVAKSAPNTNTQNSVNPIQPKTVPDSVISQLDAAVKEVKAAYLEAKKAYRIPRVRRQRVQDILSTYLGTQNFHNYTVQKSFKDASAKRVIKSFNVGPKAVIINNTEWLSLKVHGQSFMMHQIRKMVAMAALVVRCGSDPRIVRESFGPNNISIPKAPGLGLLLERPVFDSYNERAVRELAREKLDFDKFQKEMDDFKQKEIYERIFREEEKEHQFHTFFHHIDHYRSAYFLWVTAEGISASKQSLIKEEERKEGLENVGLDSEDEADAEGGEEG